MKVFLSWSGERSRLVAELLSDWLSCVIQAISPWVSSRDIDRGSLWFTEIGNALQDVTTGIVCLTEENKQRPWILFEAGALAKGLSTQRVITLLIDLEPKDITDPLAQFNHALPTEAGVRGLVWTINKNLLDRAVSDRTLEAVFQTFWPEFDQKFKAILEKTQSTTPPAKKAKVDPSEQMLEILRRLDIRTRESSQPTPVVARDTPIGNPARMSGGEISPADLYSQKWPVHQVEKLEKMLKEAEIHGYNSAFGNAAFGRPFPEKSE